MNDDSGVKVHSIMYGYVNVRSYYRGDDGYDIYCTLCAVCVYTSVREFNDSGQSGKTGRETLVSEKRGAFPSNAESSPLKNHE